MTFYDANHLMFYDNFFSLCSSECSKPANVNGDVKRTSCTSQDSEKQSKSQQVLPKTVVMIFSEGEPRRDASSVSINRKTPPPTSNACSNGEFREILISVIMSI